MKAVYVCVSAKSDYYLEQTYASIVTLKKNTPNVFVSLIVDDDTERSFCDGRENIRNVCDEIVVKAFDQSISKKVRSRILKTSMRNLVDGDFLYIDGDTFVFDDLSEIEKSPYSLAGVQDENCKLSENGQKFTHQSLRSQVCKDREFLNSEVYINGGVLWVKDTVQNRDFFASWLEEYLKYEKKGVSQDMPSLSLVNYKRKNVIRELDGSWNCQIESGAQFFHNVKIFHYFASHAQQKSLNDLFGLIREKRFNDEARLYIENNYKQIAFDFGPCSLSRGVEHEIQATAFYRALIFLYKKHRFVFNVMEKIMSLGRGRGFYFKA